MLTVLLALLLCSLIVGGWLLRRRQHSLASYFFCAALGLFLGMASNFLLFVVLSQSGWNPLDVAMPYLMEYAPVLLLPLMFSEILSAVVGLVFGVLYARARQKRINAAR